MAAVYQVRKRRREDEGPARRSRREGVGEEGVRGRATSWARMAAAGGAARDMAEDSSQKEEGKEVGKFIARESRGTSPGEGLNSLQVLSLSVCSAKLMIAKDEGES